MNVVMLAFIFIAIAGANALGIRPSPGANALVQTSWAVAKGNLSINERTALVQKADVLDLQGNFAELEASRVMSTYMSYISTLGSKLSPTTQSELVVPRLVDTGSGKKFRTQNCSKFMESFSQEDAVILHNAHVHALQKSISKPKVACMIYSHKGARQEQRDSFAAWGQDCDEFFVFSDETWADREAGFTTIEVHPKNGDERNLVGKLRASFREVQRRLDSNEISFDFLTVSGDDSFWIVANLRYELQRNMEVQNASKDKGVCFGHIFRINNAIDFPSGAGYVLDKKALETYVNDDVVDEMHSSWAEDVSIAEVLARHGIQMLHAQEATGEHLMSFFRPRDMASPTLYTDGGWVRNYEEPFFDKMKGKTGIQLISQRSILFHYTKRQREQMYNIIYGAKTCGSG